MLSVRALEAGYGSIEVLRKLSLEVPTGKIVALLGGNGAGKTTTMRAIAGLLPARGGEILLDGAPVHRLPAHKVFQRGIALVAQGRELFPEMTVRENLELGALAAPTRRDSGRLIDEIFARFPRLGERADQRAASLSGGEQQMLATGRALMSKPTVLLLDEPTTGLAPIIVNELQRIILELNRAGQTILVVEQNVRLALAVAHHVYVMRQGAIVMDRPAGELAGSDEMFRAYLG
jgi:branched-chain amino acid transport system ATP-binding protein